MDLSNWDIVLFLKIFVVVSIHVCDGVPGIVGFLLVPEKDLVFIILNRP